MNHRVVLRRRPTGLVQPDDVELVEEPLSELADGEALVRTDAIGIDAAVRTWLEDQPGYLPPVAIGETVRAATVGEIVETRCPAYEVGDVVTSLGGFADHSVASDDLFTTIVLAMHGRVVLCGVISSYLSSEHPGPANYVKLLAMRGRMEGFNTMDQWDRYPEANAELRRLMDAGALRYRCHRFEGLDAAVPALNALFEGTNIGKTVLRP